MSKPAGKAGALSAFFKSKGKAGSRSVGTDEMGSNSGGGGGGGGGGGSGFDLGLSGLALPGLFDSSATGWDDAPVAIASDEATPLAAPVVETVVRDQLKVQLRELEDNEAEDETAMRKRIESEEARKSIEAAKRHALRAARKTAGAAEAEASGVTVAPTSTLPSSGSFAARLAARNAGIVDKDGFTAPTAKAVAGVKDGKVLTKDVFAFPTLGGATAA